MTVNRFLCTALVASFALGGTAVGSGGLAFATGITLPQSAATAPMPRPDHVTRPMPRPASNNAVLRPKARPTEQLASISLGF